MEYKSRLQVKDKLFSQSGQKQITQTDTTNSTLLQEYVILVLLLLVHY